MFPLIYGRVIMHGRMIVGKKSIRAYFSFNYVKDYNDILRHLSFNIRKKRKITRNNWFSFVAFQGEITSVLKYKPFPPESSMFIFELN